MKKRFKMQENLFSIKIGNPRIIILRERKEFFEVVNSEDYKDDTSILRLSSIGKEMYNREGITDIEVMKKKFEEEAKKCYRADKVEWLKDEENSFGWTGSKEADEYRDKMHKLEQELIADGCLEEDRGIETYSLAEFKRTIFKKCKNFIVLKKCLNLHLEFYQKLYNTEEFDKKTPCPLNIKRIWKFSEENTLFKGKLHNCLLEQKKKENKKLVEGKKVIVKVKYGLDFENKRDFSIDDNRRELEIECYLGGVDSSAFKNTGMSLEKAEEDAVEWVIKDIIEDGIPRENIEVIKKEMTEEDLKEHNKKMEEERKRKLEYAERDIKEHSEKLKESLKIKEELEKK